MFKTKVRLKYKSFIGKAIYDTEFQIYHGDVCDIKDVITFQARNISELKKAFRDSVNDYLVFCNERNKPHRRGSGV